VILKDKHIRISVEFPNNLKPSELLIVRAIIFSHDFSKKWSIYNKTYDPLLPLLSELEPEPEDEDQLLSCPDEEDEPPLSGAEGPLLLPSEDEDEDCQNHLLLLRQQSSSHVYSRPLHVQHVQPLSEPQSSSTSVLAR
jgi:hypothetical protein